MISPSFETLNKSLTELGRDVATSHNHENENIVVSRDGPDTVEVRTFQKNGWVRVNVYHLDGTTEELYERGNR